MGQERALTARALRTGKPAANHHFRMVPTRLEKNELHARFEIEPNIP